MGDYYHHFLTSISGVTGAQGMSPPDAHSPQFPGSQIAMMGGAMPGPYSNLGYFTGFPDPVGFSAPKSSRNRRKSAPGLDHVKHRRTRSGCYMCRSRRVKVGLSVLPTSLCGSDCPNSVMKPGRFATVCEPIDAEMTEKT